MAAAFPFLRSLLQALPHSPDSALRALYWRVLGKRVRAQNILLRSGAVSFSGYYGAGPSYAEWLRQQRGVDRAGASRELAGWQDPPPLALLMPLHRPRCADFEAAVESVRQQYYPHWTLHIGVDGPQEKAVDGCLERLQHSERRIRVHRFDRHGGICRTGNAVLEHIEAPYTAFMDQDDLLEPDALFAVARALRAMPGARILYTDEDMLDAAGRRYDPHFKPAWNRELLLAQNYINHLCVVRSDDLRAVGGLRPGFEGSQDHDLLLRLLQRVKDEEIVHIPRPLYHWRQHAGSGSFSDANDGRVRASRLRAVQEYLDRHEPGARAVPGHHGFCRVVRPLPQPQPQVTLIVPTRDRLPFLRRCVDGLLQRTDYDNREIIIVDNGSELAETRDWLEAIAGQPGVRVLAAPGPFNFSRLNNLAVAAADGDVVALVNNDIEVIDAGWLREMVANAIRPEVGAVGARLLYGGGREGARRLQHAGCILGIGGVAGHSHKFFDEDAPGYFFRPHLPQYVSAVTAACLVVGRAKYLEVGGLDEEALAVAFNDVDLCLRLLQHGYRNLYTPYATLVHHESVSRGSDLSSDNRERFAREVAVMHSRWGDALRRDPCYNPNLTRRFEDFSLAGEEEMDDGGVRDLVARGMR